MAAALSLSLEVFSYNGSFDSYASKADRTLHLRTKEDVQIGRDACLFLVKGNHQAGQATEKAVAGKRTLPYKLTPLSVCTLTAKQSKKKDEGLALALVPPTSLQSLLMHLSDNGIKAQQIHLHDTSYNGQTPTGTKAVEKAVLEMATKDVQSASTHLSAYVCTTSCQHAYIVAVSSVDEWPI